VPPYLLALAEDTWDNSWNSLPTGVMPIPVSATASVSSRGRSPVLGEAMVNTFLVGFIGIARQVSRDGGTSLVTVDRIEVRWAIERAGELATPNPHSQPRLCAVSHI
jgi:hypothetical protein